MENTLYLNLRGLGVKFGILLLLTLLIGCAMTSKNDYRNEGPRIHNLAPAFIEYGNIIEGKSIDEQMKQLKSTFFPKFPEFYQYKIDKWVKAGKNPDEELIKQLQEYQQIKTEFAQKTRDISANLEDTIKSFTEAFPDLDKNFDVYIIHSFGEMDGGMRTIGGKSVFILGIDGMVKYHKGFTSEVPFFHHELFHVYHAQFLPDNHGIWLSLWSEGLATYISKKLNPNASLKEMLLGLPEGMTEDIKKTWDYHWKDLSSKLTSAKDEDYESYFLFSSKHKKIIKRAGYYLGYLIAEEIGKTKTVTEMAKMSSNEVLPLIKKAIHTIQTTSAVSSNQSH